MYPKPFSKNQEYLLSDADKLDCERGGRFLQVVEREVPMSMVKRISRATVL